MSNKITINVTIHCAAYHCRETSQGTMDLVDHYAEPEGTIRIERLPASVPVFSNLQVLKEGWGIASPTHPRYALRGDWLCQKCL